MVVYMLPAKVPNQIFIFMCGCVCVYLRIIRECIDSGQMPDNIYIYIYITACQSTAYVYPPTYKHTQTHTHFDGIPEHSAISHNFSDYGQNGCTEKTGGQ